MSQTSRAAEENEPDIGWGQCIWHQKPHCFISSMVCSELGTKRMKDLC